MTWKKTIGQKRQIQNVDGRNNVPDGGWGWVVTFACCIGIAISMSFVSTFGLFYSRMIEEFQLEMTTLTLVGAAHTAIAMAGAIVVVPIVEKCGERIVLITGGLLQFIGCFAVGLMTSFPFLFLFIGIIWGIGSSLTYVTFLMSVDKYFHKKKAIAISLASTGASLSMTIFTPVAEVLLDMYGFSGGMMVFAAISLNTVVCGAVVFPLKGKGNEVSKTHDPVDMSFCKRPGFIIYLLSNAMFIAGYYIPIGLLPETASSTGVSLDDISLTFSLSGLIQILGRLVFGFISHRCPSRITKLWISYLVAMGLTLLIIPFSTTLYHYLIFNLFGGFFIGGSSLGFNLALKNIIEPKYYGRGLSLALLMQGLGGFVGNPVAAFLQEVTGDEGMAYYFGSLVLIVSGLILLPFSRAIQTKTTEIEVTVVDNSHNYYIRDEGLFGYSYI